MDMTLSIVICAIGALVYLLIVVAENRHIKKLNPEEPKRAQYKGKKVELGGISDGRNNDDNNRYNRF